MKRHASMNRIYRLVWSQVRKAWVAVSEHAKGRGKSGRSGSVLRRKVIVAALSLAFAPLAQAGPIGGQLVSGAGSISQSGNTTNIQQASQNLSLNWQSFNIAPAETVNFLQPSAAAIAVNRIFDTNGSQILGHLNANGQVWLINPNGVLFGQGAQVNVGGLIASTLDFNDATLNSNARSFSGNGTGSVVNQGTINAANGGYVALLGNHVSNQGTVTAQLGTVALGAGSAATLTFSGNSLVHMQVDQSTLNNLAENGGLIQADGGTVIMTAGAKNALLASVVNNTGVIEANTVENHEGTITLLGSMTSGTVNVGGTLDASAPNGGNGGQIETSAENVKIANTAHVTTAAVSGLTGSWLLDPVDFTIASSGGDVTGSALGTLLGSNSITIQTTTGTNTSTNLYANGSTGTGNINVNDAVTWSTHKLTLTATNDVNINAVMTANNTASLDLEPGSGNVNVGLGPTGSSFTGKVNFFQANGTTPRSGTGFLTISGTPYTVITSVGSQGDELTGPATLQGMAATTNLGGHYALGSDITNASITSGWNSGAGFVPIGNLTNNFSGTFDGLGHTISGLTINLSTNGVGLFGYGFSTSVIRNVGLVGGTVTGSNYVGGLVGSNSGMVSNSFSTGSVTGTGTGVQTGTGGLVGSNSGTVFYSFASGTVNGTTNVGGLVGNNYGTVSFSYGSGNVSGTTNVGGLVGSNSGMVMYGIATGSVTGTTNVGGLVGNNYGTVSFSYGSGNVSGTTNVGGLVGSNSGMVMYGIATGSVTGTTNVGGLVGINSSYGTVIGSVIGSNATGSVSGSNYVGGLVGINYGSVSSSYATGGVSSTGYTNIITGSVVSFVGGLVGSNGNNGNNTTASISNSYATSNVTGSGNNVGGLVGANYGLVSSSYATGTVTGLINNVGGLVGTNGIAGSTTASISNSYATGNVTGTGSGVGGLVGSNYGAVSNSYATGSVSGLSGSSYVGGLVGYNSYGTVTNSYAMGSVSGSSYVGGLAGYNYGGTVSNSFFFYSNTVNSTLSTIGTTGINAGTTTGSNGLTSTQMMQLASFSSWNTGTTTIDNTGASGMVWRIYEGNTAPLLVSFLTPLTLTGATDATVTYNGSTQPFSTYTGSVEYGASNSISGVLDAGALTASRNVGFYNRYYSTQQGYDITGGNLTITPLALTGSITTGSSTYGSALVAGTASFGNVVPGDVVTPGAVTVTPDVTSTSGHLTAGTHTGIESVGTTLSGADAANYTFAGATGDYTVIPLALTGTIAAGSSVYGAALQTSQAVTPTGVVSGDVMGAYTVVENTTGLLSSSNHLIAGTHNGIETVTGASGADAGNYTYAGITAGNYTVSPLALTGTIAAGSSVYGAALQTSQAVTPANLVTGDVITSYTVAENTTGLLSSSNHLIAGTHNGIETVTGASGADAGNYTYAGITAGNYTVSPLALTGTIAAGSSVYGAALQTSQAVTPTGVVSGDVMGAYTVVENTTGLLSSSNHLIAGTHNGIETVTGASGADAGNYTYAGITAGNYTVSPLALTGTIAAGSSVYGAALQTSQAVTPANLVTGDVITSYTVAENTTGLLSSSNHLIAGTHNGIETVTGASGADAGNYTYAGITAGNYTVSPLALTGTIAAGSSVYGAALQTSQAVTPTGVVSGDVMGAYTVVENTTGLLSSSNHLIAGTHNGIETVTGASGADAGNYTYAGITAGNYTVSPLALTGTIAAGSSVYGAALQTSQAVTPANLVTGDVITSYTVAENTTGLLSSSNHLIAGTHNGIETVTGASGADAGNYTYAGITAGNYTVSPLAITASGITVTPKIYDGTTTAALNVGTASFSGIISGDSVSIATSSISGSFADKNVGTNKTVNLSGVTLSGTDAVNYSLNGVAGVTGNITPLAITVAATGVNKVYDATVNDPATLASAGVIAGDVVTFADTSATFANKNVGTGKTVSVAGITAGGTDGGNYTVNPTATTTANITPLAITVAATGANKVYDATVNDAATLASAGVIAGDVVTFADTSATFADKNVGTGKTVSVAGITAGGTDGGNYTVNPTATTTANITPLAITVAATGANKVYDATVNDAATLASAGVIAGDVVTFADTSATFADKNVGTGKTVSIAGITAGGTDAGNYTVNTAATTTANITPLAITVAATGANKVYDATVNDAATLASAGVIAGDVVTFADTSATFADKNVGTSKTVSVAGITAGGTDGGNYTVNTTATTTANITPASLTVTGVNASNKVYDATTAATLGGTAAVTALASDVVSVTGTGSGVFSDKNVGNGKTVTVSGFTLGGTDAGNYSIVEPTGITANITPLAITVAATGANKVYDATVNDAATLASAGVIAGDVVTFADTSATFADKNVGTGKTVSVAGITAGGTDGGNYTVNPTATTTANITPLAITVAATGANKVYDATVNDAATLASAGVIAGDVVTFADTSATFADKNVGTSKTVSVAGITAGGTDGGNYTVNSTATTTANITPLALTGTIAAGSSVYGAALQTSQAVTPTGVVSGDVMGAYTVVENTTGLLSSSNHLIAGTHNGIETVTGASGADAGNYTYAGITAGNYTVSPLALTGTIAAGSSVYGAALVAGTASFSNVVGNDVVTPGAVTVTPDVTSTSGHLTAGTHTGIESVGGTLGGTDAGNYTFAGATGNYTVSPLALTGTIAAGSSAYGAALQTNQAVTPTGVVSGDVMGTYTVAVNTTGNTSTNGNLKVGSYTGIETVAGASGADAGNYTYAGITAGNYTVSPLVLTGDTFVFPTVPSLSSVPTPSSSALASSAQSVSSQAMNQQISRAAEIANLAPEVITTNAPAGWGTITIVDGGVLMPDDSSAP